MSNYGNLGCSPGYFESNILCGALDPRLIAVKPSSSEITTKGGEVAIIEEYDGQTFVAFTDIVGFKSMMSDEARLMRAMDSLYSSGYSNLADNNRHPIVEGIFISDCGILFARRRQETELDALGSLLDVLSSLHRDVFESAFSLTTSIAYGKFRYRGKIEFDGIEKNALHGEAYLIACIDNENDDRRLRLYPNECRICKRNLPEPVTAAEIQTLDIARGRIREEERHFYFEWMKRR